MKKNIMIIVGLALVLSGNAMADANLEKNPESIKKLQKVETTPSKGEMLFLNKCSSCHSTSRPTDMSKVIAPALMGVMRHLKMDYPDKAKAVAFIKDFTLNPTKEKAICMPKKIERFGLMPSQKGNVTTEELEIIAGWMFDNFPPKDFKGMRHGEGHGNRDGKNSGSESK